MVRKRPREESSDEEEGGQEERESDDRQSLVGDGESWQEVVVETKDPLRRGGDRVRVQVQDEQQEEEEEADWEDLSSMPGSETQSLSEEAIRVVSSFSFVQRPQAILASNLFISLLRRPSRIDPCPDASQNRPQNM